MKATQIFKIHVLDDFDVEASTKKALKSLFFVLWIDQQVITWMSFVVLFKTILEVKEPCLSLIDIGDNVEGRLATVEYVLDSIHRNYL